MVALSKHLKEAIENRDIVRIRSAMTVIVHEDPSFSTGKFDQTLEYLKTKNIGGLIVPYDGEEFLPSDQWDEDYWALLVSSFVDNFSEKRIAHLKEVSKVLYPKQAKTEARSGETCIKDESKQIDGEAQKKELLIIVTAGLAVTCVVGAVVGAKGLAAAAGVAAVVAGTYTILKK